MSTPDLRLKDKLQININEAKDELLKFHDTFKRRRYLANLLAMEAELWYLRGLLFSLYEVMHVDELKEYHYFERKINREIINAVRDRNDEVERIIRQKCKI